MAKKRLQKKKAAAAAKTEQTLSTPVSDTKLKRKK